MGDEAKGVSASTVVRLKSIWESEYKEWLKRDLNHKQYVYFWVDGIYCNVRMEEKSCILVIIAADEQGNKELLAIDDGFRESKISWKDILLSLKDRGLKDGPKLAIGDGALGFWAALREVFPETGEQRCWVHKTANILDKLPKTLQPKAKNQIHEMYMAENKENALLSYERFIGIYTDKYPKAVNCLEKDKDRLFAFYDYPAVHWTHIRTTNPIESTFATVRHRSYRTKNCSNRVTTLTMVYKLVMESEKNWHKLKGYKMIPLILQGASFKDGVLKDAA